MVEMKIKMTDGQVAENSGEGVVCVLNIGGAHQTVLGGTIDGFTAERLMEIALKLICRLGGDVTDFLGTAIRIAGERVDEDGEET